MQTKHVFKNNFDLLINLRSVTLCFNNNTIVRCGVALEARGDRQQRQVERVVDALKQRT